MPTTSTENSSDSMKYWWIGILLATCVGTAARFADLGGQSFWYDEAYSARIAEQATTWELWTGLRKDNGNPPLYYMAHRWAVSVFGTSEAGQRTLAALCGVLTIPLIGLLGRRIAQQWAGLIAAWLFALSPLSVELSNEARTYSMVHLAVTLSALLFIRWLSTMRWSDGVAYLLVTAAACYLHYFVVFFIMSQALAVVVVPQRSRAVWRWCVLMLGVAAIWSCWVLAFLEQVTTPGNLSRMGDAWKMQFASTPVVFSVGRTFAWRDAGPWLLGAAALISLIGFCLPALLGWWKVIRTQPAEGVFLAGWIVLPVLLPLLVAVLLSPIYHHRYGSVGLPAFLILTAIGLGYLSQWMRPIAVTAIVVGTAFSLTNYYTQPLKDDWRSAAHVVLTGASENQCVLADQDSEVLPLLYYARRQGVVPRELYGLNTAEESQGRLRAVRYDAGRKLDADFTDYTDRILQSPRICLALCVPSQSLETHREFFERHGYRLVDEQQFYRVTIAQFERSPEVEIFADNEPRSR